MPIFVYGNDGVPRESRGPAVNQQPVQNGFVMGNDGAWRNFFRRELIPFNGSRTAGQGTGFASGLHYAGGGGGPFGNWNVTLDRIRLSARGDGDREGWAGFDMWNVPAIGFTQVNVETQHLQTGSDMIIMARHLHTIIGQTNRELLSGNQVFSFRINPITTGYVHLSFEMNTWVTTQRNWDIIRVWMT